MRLLDLVKENLEEQQELDEAGAKDVVLGALMSLPFINSSQAAELRKAVNVLPKDSSKIVSAIKDTSNKAELGNVLKSISNPSIKRENIPTPSGYRPLSSTHRKDWNKYLEYLNGVGLKGSAELDGGTPTLGRKVFGDYLKKNPNSSLNDFDNQNDLIKFIQYEMKVLRGGTNGKPFGLTDQELKGFQDFLWKKRNKFMTMRTSDSDGNPGQYTTQEYYPAFSGGSDLDYRKYKDYFLN